LCDLTTIHINLDSINLNDAFILARRNPNSSPRNVNLTTYIADLSTCNVDLSTYIIDLTSCNLGLSTCNAGLSGCSVNLSCRNGT
jgi:hypothetical protein